MKSIIKIFAIILASLLLASPVFPQGSWSSLPNTPSKRTEASVALLDGKIYLIGGFTPQGIADKVEALDMKTGVWQEVSPLPVPLHHTTATALQGKLYVIGGFKSGRWSPVDTTYEYDPQKNTWTEKSKMPTKRGAQAAAVLNGEIHVVGGANKKIFRMVNTGAHEVYDPAADNWQTLPALPTPRDHLTATTLKGQLYVFGGRVKGNYNNNLDSNEAYDPKTKMWSAKKPLPTKRSGITSQVLNGKIHVFGGESGEGTFTENEAYDPSRDHWETMAPMPVGRHGLGCAVWEGKIHVLTGGPKPGGGGSNIHSAFQPTGP